MTSLRSLHADGDCYSESCRYCSDAHDAHVESCAGCEKCSEKCGECGTFDRKHDGVRCGDAPEHGYACHDLMGGGCSCGLSQAKDGAA